MRSGPAQGSRLLALTCLAAVLAGCSGRADPRLVPDELAARAQAVCVRAAEAVAGLDPVDLRDGEAAALGVRDVVEVQREALDDLLLLPPPGELEDDYARWLDLVGDALAQAEALAVALETGDVTAAEDASARAGDLSEDADRVARELGLDACVAG
ncbi:MAG: hypothetical protein M5U14_18080 [Acidimicrobiia bacterium]|nr:hypothetical protein [Acidimicrobiia bacterium]